jgi:hypothetical protein
LENGRFMAGVNAAPEYTKVEVTSWSYLPMRILTAEFDMNYEPRHGRL